MYIFILYLFTYIIYLYMNLCIFTENFYPLMQVLHQDSLHQYFVM